MKIHLACGKHVLDGWTNCDIERHSKAPREPDVLCDVRNIPLPDGKADELMAIHILEHFYLWEVPEVLSEWRRLLKKGGKLVLEMPDIVKCAKNLANGCGDNYGMWGMYGDPTLKNHYHCHKWGWTFKTIKPVLEKIGFDEIVECDPQWHGKKVSRDFRVECRRVG